MFKLHHGDCLEVLRGMADHSVDSIVTDPPYGLSFMGKRWDYDVPAVEVWAECLRVLKPGGHLLAFAGTRTQHRMAVRIEDAGFEIRDMIAWVYGSGFPKSADFAGFRDEDKQRQIKPEFIGHPQAEGWGTALKPALEPITVARKPLAGTVAANVLEYGTGALNIDDCRILTPGEERAPITGKGGMPARHDERQPRDAGTVMQPHELGRWPANLIHDGAEDVLAAFPPAPGQQGDLKETGRPRPSSGRFGDMGPPRTHLARDKQRGATSFGVQAGQRRLDDGSAARFFYCAKADRTDRNEGTEALPQRIGGMVSNTSGQHITRRDEGYEAKPQGNHHPTVKPTDLMRYLCRLVTPPGGTVLDLFMGSGSTGKAAILEGFDFVGIEREAEYLAIARARIAFAQLVGHQPSLLQEVA